MANLKEIEKLLTKYNKGRQFPVSVQSFTDNAKRYLKAIQDRRVICNIESVSRSGMSRNMRFVEISKRGGSYGHSMLNFYELFKILGFTQAKDSDCFRIGGCGMDMVFATNYRIVGQLRNLGIVTKARASKLQQMTPHVI